MKRILVLLLFAMVTAAFVTASSVYDPQTSMHGTTTPGGNHPHTSNAQGTNYVATQVTNHTSIAPKPAATPTPTEAKPISCSSTCPENYVQAAFPSCSCTIKESVCENVCGDAYSQAAFPDCSCTLKDTTVNICYNKCTYGYAQEAYPSCLCVAPKPTSTCTEKCSAGNSQKPFPDCRCYMAQTIQPAQTSTSAQTGWNDGKTGWANGRPGDNRPHH